MVGLRPALLAARLPVRARVTLAFTAVVAVLLAIAGIVVYVRLGHSLIDTIDQGLRTRAGDVITLIDETEAPLSEPGRSPLARRGESLAQILDRRGRVVDAPPRLRRVALLTAADIARARGHTLVVERRTATLEPDRVRLLATPVTAQGRHLIVVVGTSLETTDAARQQLGRLLLIGGPIALLLAALTGYGAVAGALRPVERMRRRAAGIQATQPGRRLPVPPSNDEVARLGQTLNAMLDRLEVAIQHERRFVADASHELRTPLAILKTELELALRDAEGVGDFRAAVISAADEADRLVQLAEDLLVIARSDQGRLPVRAETVSARAILETVKRRFDRRASDHAIRLTVDAPADLTLQADAARLEQALGNLMDNALRHGADSVWLQARAHDGSIALHVRDDGDGFPPAFRDRAFERFSRADAARSGAGSGLGLAIVRAIAQAHGGDAHAAAAEGGGADVWIDLPAAPGGPEA